MRERIFVLSLLLSNVKNRTEKINSPPSPEKQQQGEINWEGKHCPSPTSAGAETKARSSPPQALLPERQNLSDTVRMPNCIAYYNVFQFGGSGIGEQNLADGRKIT